MTLPPEIMGPGIEEEYADLLERIEKLGPLFAPFLETNDTFEGRMRFQLAWLRQEIEAGRLPIPLDKKYWGTLSYLVAEGAVDYLGGAKEMGEMTAILDGTGMLKPRHTPVVVAMLDDFLKFLQPHTAGLDPKEQRFLRDTVKIRRDLEGGWITLPLLYDAFPGWKTPWEFPHLNALPDFWQRAWNLDGPLFYSVRPWPCRKGPLAPPNPSPLAFDPDDKRT
jgi:hypothetical protein